MHYPKVIWKGYQLDQESFKKFTTAIFPVTPPDTEFVTLITYYDWWADRLPREISKKAPNTCYRFSGEKITHVLFCTRDYVRYRNKRQLEDFTEPTEKDKQTLETWLRYVNQNSNGKEHVGPSMFEFAVLKDVDPAYD